MTENSFDRALQIKEELNTVNNYLVKIQDKTAIKIVFGLQDGTYSEVSKDIDLLENLRTDLLQFYVAQKQTLQDEFDKL